MSRYVEVDAFDERVRISVGLVEEELTDDYKDGVRCTLEMLKTQPTVDVVEVVRCRDCTWWKSIFSWNGKEHKVCVRESAEPLRESDDYCSYGERRTE